MAASEGADLEWAIVEVLNGTKLSRVYSDKIKRQATDCVEHIRKFAGQSPIIAWHSDDPKNPVGKAISAKPEPKTDIILKIATKIYYVSVKMAGGVQLASGQGSSTADLFEAAAAQIKNSAKSKVLHSIIKELRTLPTRMLSSANQKRIVNEASDKIISEFIKGGKIITDKSYDFWLKNNKPKLMETLLNYIEKDSDFKLALLKESMTGKITLKNDRGAAADSIISPKGFYIIDDTYVKSVFNKVKFDIRGKSRSGITGIAFRIDLKP
jgi:hypothetical protein